MRILCRIILLCCVICLPQAASANKTILYIPIDDRPVCLSYVKETINAAGYDLLLPPQGSLSTCDESGNITQLWEWLESEAPKAQAAVISTDSLCYGGLVASRKHEYSSRFLAKKLERLQGLKEIAPDLRIYAFSTIMRTPRQTFGNVEPDYYQRFGPKIFRLSQLFDKEDQQKLTIAEKKEQDTLQRKIPAYLLQDWYKRRSKNFKTNVGLIDLVKKNCFHFLAIGKDDDAVLSQTHMEGRHIIHTAKGLPAKKFQIISGVDQLGLLLLTRAINERENERPCVYVLYAPGKGGSAIPLYSDQTAAESVEQQIAIVNGRMVTSVQKADIIFAVNTPFDGITKDSTSNENASYVAIYNKVFADKLQESLSSHPVALADISYANGADNGFMAELANRRLLAKLTAYSGWNTADNSIGFSLSQGILASKMLPQDRERLLIVRYLDDWIYQSNIRARLARGIDRHDFMLKYNLGLYSKQVLNSTKPLFAKYLSKEPFLRNTKFTVDFPWNRLFEIDVQVN